MPMVSACGRGGVVMATIGRARGKFVRIISSSYSFRISKHVCLTNKCRNGALLSTGGRGPLCFPVGSAISVNKGRNVVTLSIRSGGLVTFGRGRVRSMVIAGNREVGRITLLPSSSAVFGTTSALGARRVSMSIKYKCGSDLYEIKSGGV